LKNGYKDKLLRNCTLQTFGVFGEQKMCGINGFNWTDRDLINKMNKCIKHRGPDVDGIFVGDYLSLGHTRL